MLRGPAIIAGLVAIAVITGFLVLAATAPISTGDKRSPDRSAGPSVTTMPFPASSTIPPNSVPQRGGALIYALPSPGYRLDLDLYGRRLTPADLIEGHAMFDPLFAFDVNGRAVPYLAEQASGAADHRTWTIKLRPGVRFHDDTPADAEALARHLEAARQSVVLAPLLRPISDVSVLDAESVKIGLAEPWATFPVALTGQAGLLSGRVGPDGVPVGTGPFVTDKFESSDVRRLTAAPRYWRPGLPLIDTLAFRYVPDGQERERLLKSGEIDAMRLDGTERGTSVELISAVDPGRFQFITDTIAPAAYLVTLDTSRPPFDDAATRQRLTDATNRDDLIASLFSGASTPIADLPVPTAPGLAFSPSTTALGEAGPLPNELRTSPTVAFSLLIDTRLESTAISDGLRQQWLRFGFDVAVTAVEDVQDYLSKPHAHNAVLMVGAGGSDPALDAPLWDPGARIDGSPPFPTALGVGDQVLREAAHTGRASPDPSTRLAAYQHASNRLAELQPIIWLASNRPSVVASPRVRAFVNSTLPDGSPAATFDGSGVHRLTEAWLSRS